jgi:hypothetical protein
VGGGVSMPSIEPKQNKTTSSIVKWTEITRKPDGLVFGKSDCPILSGPTAVRGAAGLR